MRGSSCSIGIRITCGCSTSKDDQGLARVTPKQLLECCLRMKPDRILLAELRGEEAFDYLRNVNSGHPGSITSVHAASCELAFEQLVLLVKQSRAGQELAREEIKQPALSADRRRHAVRRRAAPSAASRRSGMTPHRKRRSAGRGRLGGRGLAGGLKVAAMLLAAVVVAQYLAGYLFLVLVRLDPRKRRRSRWRATPITTATAPTCGGRCSGPRQPGRRSSPQWRWPSCSAGARALARRCAVCDAS